MYDVYKIINSYKAIKLFLKILHYTLLTVTSDFLGHEARWIPCVVEEHNFSKLSFLKRKRNNL